MASGIALIAIVVIDVIICTVMVHAGGNRPNRHFVEGGLITWVNTAQILGLGLFAAAVYRARLSSNEPAGARFWIIVALGALFLAIDENVELHEKSGQFLRHLRLPRPPLVNGWGDVVLLSYALPVLLVCWSFRRELTADHAVLRTFLLGTVILVISELIDTFGVHQGRERFWWSVSEESTKVIGFGVLLAAVFGRWRSARARTPTPDETPLALS